MSRPLVYLPDVARDFADAFAYYEALSPAAALNFEQAFGAAASEVEAGLRSHLPLPRDQAQAELRKELALALYAQGTLTSGQLCAWLGLTRWEGEELLAQRRILRSYAADDLNAELRNARHGL